MTVEQDAAVAGLRPSPPAWALPPSLQQQWPVLQPAQVTHQTPPFLVSHVSVQASVESSGSVWRVRLDCSK